MAKAAKAQKPKKDEEVKRLNDLHVKKHSVPANRNDAKFRNKRVIGTVNNRLS